ncbi:hypothetical protein [Candidatus Poriferisodalis sp.]|uniref:hypothetical protein n=1 Tax=Candidatus Poriferisodalis sp. TaxID=3101277 RepID=UPI003B5AD929
MAGEPQIVERLGAIGRIPGTGRQVVLAQHHLGGGPGAELRVRLASPGFLDVGESLLVVADGEVVEGVANNLGRGERLQPLRGLHGVGVSVVDDPVLDVGHGSSP